ncbi:hypothetical protein FRC11_013832 [Ceratobasidium sp. 423]|nr:hypothetical protein FRC11_013832 [Ceratobasidium sp. 423]
MAPLAIQVDLKDKTKLYSRAKEALEGWDKTWDVWTLEDTDGEERKQHLGHELVSDRPMSELPHTMKKVEPETVLLKDVLVPHGLPLEDEDESWVDLFEWVGMCMIGQNGSPRQAPKLDDKRDLTNAIWQNRLWEPDQPLYLKLFGTRRIQDSISNSIPLGRSIVT